MKIGLTTRSNGAANSTSNERNVGMFKLSTLLLAVLIGMAAHITPARGAMITVALNNFVFQGGSANTQLERDEVIAVPRFDSNLGTLDEVFIAIQHSSIGSVVTADSSASLPFAMVGVETTSRATIRASRFNGLTPVELASSSESADLAPDDPPGAFGTFPANTDVGLPDFLDDVVVFRGAVGADSADALLTDAISLAAFTGAGSIPLLIELNLISGLNGPAASLQALYGNSAGQLLVRYTFTEPNVTPVTAPGPAWLVLGAAVFGLRRRSAPRAPAPS